MRAVRYTLLILLRRTAARSCRSWFAGVYIVTGTRDPPALSPVRLCAAACLPRAHPSLVWLQRRESRERRPTLLSRFCLAPSCCPHRRYCRYCGSLLGFRSAPSLSRAAALVAPGPLAAAGAATLHHTPTTNATAHLPAHAGGPLGAVLSSLPAPASLAGFPGWDAATATSHPMLGMMQQQLIQQQLLLQHQDAEAQRLQVCRVEPGAGTCNAAADSLATSLPVCWQQELDALEAQRNAERRERQRKRYDRVLNTAVTRSGGEAAGTEHMASAILQQGGHAVSSARAPPFTSPAPQLRQEAWPAGIWSKTWRCAH